MLDYTLGRGRGVEGLDVWQRVMIVEMRMVDLVMMEREKNGEAYQSRKVRICLLLLCV